MNQCYMIDVDVDCVMMIFCNNQGPLLSTWVNINPKMDK